MKKLLLIGLLGLVSYEANAMFARAAKTAARQAKTIASSLNPRDFSTLNEVLSADPLLVSQSIVNLLLLGQNYLTNQSLDFHWNRYQKLRDKTDDKFTEHNDKLKKLEEALNQIKSQQDRDNERA